MSSRLKPRVIWVRSLVPKLKNSAVSAIWSAAMAARVKAHELERVQLEREVLAAGQHFWRDGDVGRVVLDRRDRNTGRDAAHHRHRDRMATIIVVG